MGLSRFLLENSEGGKEPKIKTNESEKFSPEEGGNKQLD